MNVPEFGLPDRTIAIIRQVLADAPGVSKAVIYGSRAKGTYRPGSDIDLTLFGESLNLSILGEIAGKLEESSIPYHVDLSIFDRIDHVGLREHIERVGVLFYQRVDQH